MPCGHKSKHRAQDKCYHTQGEMGGKAKAAAEEWFPYSFPLWGPTLHSPFAASPPQQGPQRVPPLSTAAAGASGTRADEGAQGQDEGGQGSQHSSDTCTVDPLTWEADMLMHFLLNKYKMKEPVLMIEMMKVINKKYMAHFSKILDLASERLELVFGLDLKQVYPNKQLHAVVSKFSISNEERLNDGTEFPRNGLLLPLLSKIFLNQNRATEQEIWEFLNEVGVYEGRKHPIYGEPRQLITKDFVQEGYLEYKQVPNSDPPLYEFLWGPRAYAEISKIEVLAFLAKINNTTPKAFPRLYKEALEDEERRAVARSAASPSPRGKASAGEGCHTPIRV